MRRLPAPSPPTHRKSLSDSRCPHRRRRDRNPRRCERRGARLGGLERRRQAPRGLARRRRRRRRPDAQAGAGTHDAPRHEPRRATGPRPARRSHVLAVGAEGRRAGRPERRDRPRRRGGSRGLLPRPRLAQDRRQEGRSRPSRPHHRRPWRRARVRHRHREGAGPRARRRQAQPHAHERDGHRRQARQAPGGPRGAHRAPAAPPDEQHRRAHDPRPRRRRRRERDGGQGLRRAADGADRLARPEARAPVQARQAREDLHGRGRLAAVPDADRPVRGPDEAEEPGLERAEVRLGR